MKLSNTAVGAFALLPFVKAQYPPKPSGLTDTISIVNQQINITWKEANICETTPGVKSYSGYVHIPGKLINDTGGFDLHTYFWYFEARNNPTTAPLGIYLAGGPGEASSYAALSSESGPCYVNFDGNDTVLNPWSFNNNVNMLYFDQPVQTGLSYNTLINGTYDLETLIITPNTPGVAPLTNDTVMLGTFSNVDPDKTTNTTVTSGKALWHVLENWLASFPAYNTTSKKISFWGNSYGGFWVPESATLLDRHLKTLANTHPLKPKNLTVDAIGITNGCIDFETSMAGYPQFAYNNTYGIQYYNQSMYEDAMAALNKSDGCLDLIQQCRAAGQVGDPSFLGNNATVNELCTDAFNLCFTIIEPLNVLYNVSAFDVAIATPDQVDQCPYYLPVAEYLNIPKVQSALGLPLNWTWDSEVVTAVFGFPTPLALNGTGDAFRQAGMDNINYLLQNDIKIALLFGDRDYRCPWTGGEMTAKAATWTNSAGFLEAGYQPLQGLTSSTKGGVVKQYGPLSFTRVFDSGHSLSAYAPETVFRVFNRTTFGKDVVSGAKMIGPNYHTTGPTDSWGWRNKMPANAPFDDTCIVEGKFLPESPWVAIAE
ncbi:carboxypeptidase [Exophiala viscosa]|uniref:Carboxypeptidase n=1 Tax=Exophiala viscosa TaxID=2486360 RepID=A0AAN6IHW9_9EURO|nr:carboxypeptidase [Exophiala viscosa]